MNSFVTKAVIVGVIGDLSLQLVVKNSNKPNKFGLKSYFEQHGMEESLFIAGGMMGLFSALYGFIDPEYKVEGLIAYGTALDVIFRYFVDKRMTSLKDYYAHFSWFQTILFAVAPFLIVKML